MIIDAVLLYQGHKVEIGDTITLNEIWLSQNLRPDLTGNLPNLGDPPSPDHIHSDMSIVADNLSSLRATTITEDEYLEGNVRGTIYSVTYTSPKNSANSLEPTQNEDVVVLRINGSIGTQAYVPSNGGNLSSAELSAGVKIKDPVTNKYEPLNMTIPVVYPIINIETTKRYRDKTPVQIIEECATGGKVNSAPQWGVEKGNLLYTGASAEPVQEVINYSKEINWNITRRYQVKLITDKNGNDLSGAWQHIFYKGLWVQPVSGSQDLDFDVYPSGTLPDDLA